MWVAFSVSTTRSPVGAGLPAIAMWLTHRYRRQASSHIRMCVRLRKQAHHQTPVGAGLARDGGVSAREVSTDRWLSQASQLPQGNTFQKGPIKENPRQTQGAWRGFRVSACWRSPAQLIGKLRNPARRSRRPLALAPGRQGRRAPSHHRGCRWKQRSAYRC